MDRPVREFAPGDLEGAIAFLDALQPEYERVCVDETDDSPDCWRFIFGDQIPHVREHLARVADGRRFRIRAMW